MAIILNGTTGITTPGSTINTTAGQTFSDSSNQTTAATGFGFKNRIINGAMMIDQRNAGASVTYSSNPGYPVDRTRFEFSQVSKITGQRSTTAPAGFSNSAQGTVAAAVTPGASDYFLIGQGIEGLNVADLGWGTISAQTVTLSFWVRSSVTGTYSLRFINGSFNRTYLTSYTISAANTWEQKTITLAGDTSGTWATDNTAGIVVQWDLGAGSNATSSTTNAWQAGNYQHITGSVNWISNAGATFYITGVQLEKGSTATSFDYRPYGTELALCQRYCQRLGPLQFCGSATVRTGGIGGYASLAPKVDMRSSPTITSSGTPVIYVGDTNATITGYTAGDGTSSLLFGYTSNAAGSVGQSGLLYTNTGGSITFSAEL